ncbi:MAG TPA: PP2C family protein-serine/threonine phosphatase [Solirubrobacterales bacterium]|nr:PP2C family protein-serine/threonine phosphatase [Solirubrobacterales bacterium]
MSDEDPSPTGSRRRADARRNEERILAAARRLLEHSPAATLADIAAAAGVSRSTVYRRFPDRDRLIAKLDERPEDADVPRPEEPLPAGRLGRTRPLALDAIHVFDAVPPALLPGQLVAEAEEIGGVPVGLYLLDIDGSSLLHMAGDDRLGRSLDAPFAVGPELDADGIARVRERIARRGEVELFALWLRGRAVGAFLAFGRPREPLTELARQAAAAVTLADRYTDVFARVQRRKRPRAAAEIQQSLLPPRIVRLAGGEVAGNVLPSYEVAGDWFDVAENADGVWCTLADGLGGSTPAAASSAIALGALRAARRSGASVGEALLVMHQALREMPGSRTEMTAIVAHWDPVAEALRLHGCGHVAPLLVRADGTPVRLECAASAGLGGRSTPTPGVREERLGSGDRVVLVSDGVVRRGRGQAGVGEEGLIGAALGAGRDSASETVRAVHAAVLEESGGELADDATAVCLLVG